MTSEFFTNVRTAVLGLTGLVCLVYGGGALAMGTPQPFAFWLPGLFGVASVILISIAALAAGDDNARRATDEGYVADRRHAEGFGFWVAILLYPAFAVPLWQGWVSYPTAYAAMGTLTAAAFLLRFVWADVKGRL
ncbi:hypothetical protein [Maritalea mediterranea]|uniref:DUF2178 domain-containing protein n=1 Tax=Maritalea mediterranea TaxID=2909667 RepID=A0ABS9EDL9_9HYPH|nr:hypothetical protein [Maritalea mediterranea]MCF4099526.1 hypothetical protein [Maritalea mediterranea]